MPERYKVNIGFNVKQEDGSEIRVEPDGKWFRQSKDDEGGTISSPMDAVEIASILTPAQLARRLACVPPTLTDTEAEVEDGEDAASSDETIEVSPSLDTNPLPEIMSTEEQ